jgi:cation diffusion facilitator CzcD-associated flavoprotein CzcO
VPDRSRTVRKRSNRGRSCSSALGTTTYDEPYRPEFLASRTSRARSVHPAVLGPSRLDYTEQACRRDPVDGQPPVSMIPSLTEQAGHVTMLQRHRPPTCCRCRSNPPRGQAIRNSVADAGPANHAVRLYNTSSPVDLRGRPQGRPGSAEADPGDGEKEPARGLFRSISTSGPPMTHGTSDCA